MSCGCSNPCGPEPVNTAEAELLPSQIENFTKHFFGTVVKTESNGQVTWVLPCGLDVGLENNARGADEGLACYFLRLFREGIIGLTGPEGATGAAGSNGFNAFTVTTQGFNQPTLGAPTIVFRTSYNPAILAGINIFVQGSGWYEVTSTETDGRVFATLTRALSSASGFIPAGKLVVPAGYPGQSVTGPVGPQGPQGVQGPAGESLTESNGQYRTDVGVDYALQAVSTAVDFTTSSPSVLLPEAGTYLLTATVAIEGETGILANDDVTLRLRDTSLGANVPGSEQTVSNVADGEKSQVVLNAIYTTDGANHTVALFGDCTTSDVLTVVAARTVLTFVQIG